MSDISDVNRVPRVEARDTHRFQDDFVTEPLSVQASIYAPDGTLVTSLASAVASSNLTTFHYDHTTTTSWFTRVDSSGMFILEWTVVRSVGNDIIRRYFEVIQTD